MKGIIIFENIEECGAFYNFLEFNLIDLHDENTHNYTTIQEHPNGEKCCIFIDLFEPYKDRVETLTQNMTISPYSDEWKVQQENEE